MCSTHIIIMISRFNRIEYLFIFFFLLLSVTFLFLHLPSAQWLEKKKVLIFSCAMRDSLWDTRQGSLSPHDTLISLNVLWNIFLLLIFFYYVIKKYFFKLFNNLIFLLFFKIKLPQRHKKKFQWIFQFLF